MCTLRCEEQSGHCLTGVMRCSTGRDFLAVLTSLNMFRCKKWRVDAQTGVDTQRCPQWTQAAVQSCPTSRELADMAATTPAPAQGAAPRPAGGDRAGARRRAAPGNGYASFGGVPARGGPPAQRRQRVPAARLAAARRARGRSAPGRRRALVPGVCTSPLGVLHGAHLLHTCPAKASTAG